MVILCRMDNKKF